MAEIDDAELDRLQRQDQTIKGMAAHPEARKALLRSQKLAFPATPIAELDEPERVMTEMDARLKTRDARIEALETKIREDAEKAQQEAARNTILQAYQQQRRALLDAGWTEKGLEAVEELSRKRGIADLEAAAALYQQMFPPASPEAARGNDLQSMLLAEPAADDVDGLYMKNLLQSRGENEAVVDRQAREALAQSRAGRRGI